MQDNETTKIDGAFEVVEQNDHAIIKVGELQHHLPTLHSTEDELTGLQGFLARTQLGSIERNKQRRIRQHFANATIEVLKARLDAIVSAHKNLTRAALAEVLIAVVAFSQKSMDRGLGLVAMQYVTAISKITEDLPELVVKTNRAAAEENFLKAAANIKRLCVVPDSH